MWHSKIILFLCILLLFIFSSNAICQKGQIVPIKGFFSTDSVGARATKVLLPLHPARIDSSRLDPEKITSDSGRMQAPARPARPPRPPIQNAQWVKLNLSATRWDWRFRTSGTYAGKVLIGSIQSDGGVLVDFEGFGKLHCTDVSGDHLDTYYAISSPTSTTPQAGWMDPAQLNAYDLLFDQTDVTSAGWALWSKIIVRDFTTAGEFTDGATISIKLQNNDLWIEPLIE